MLCFDLPAVQFSAVRTVFVDMPEGQAGDARHRKIALDCLTVKLWQYDLWTGRLNKISNDFQINKSPQHDVVNMTQNCQINHARLAREAARLQ